MRERLSLKLVGKTLSEDVYLKDGVVILKKGTELTKEYVESLLKKGFVHIYVLKNK